ncbi:hypothetical protein PR202_ga11944 [Eleusine coracana subsp. coracana]|uniref:Disease resistance R13L4/SHOC-2-like LRR domain-containing protein n=1 Tax=Eleusine coracana subsp. coracana TaxID=191504 RepID=A0AAV5CAR9_ELECO|nr:hypothetical protein PR202_ga11944 [Eleusine coracana subsp. coracana]
MHKHHTPARDDEMRTTASEEKRRHRKRGAGRSHGKHRREQTGPDKAARPRKPEQARHGKRQRQGPPARTPTDGQPAGARAGQKTGHGESAARPPGESTQSGTGRRGRGAAEATRRTAREKREQNRGGTGQAGQRDTSREAVTGAAEVGNAAAQGTGGAHSRQTQDRRNSAGRAQDDGKSVCVPPNEGGNRDGAAAAQTLRRGGTEETGRRPPARVGGRAGGTQPQQRRQGAPNTEAAIAAGPVKAREQSAIDTPETPAAHKRAKRERERDRGAEAEAKRQPSEPERQHREEETRDGARRQAGDRTRAGERSTTQCHEVSAVKHAAAPDNVTMHDLVYDLARTITDNELVILDASERMDSKKFEKDYIRHMRLVKSQKQSRALKEFPAKIRSLQFTECSAELLQQNAFSKSKYLRVLDLSGCSIDGGSPRSNILLPSSIHHLILLRYLDASDLPIPQLPKSFHKLQNMQTLILSNCSLESLPDSISTLLEICYLDLSGNSRLNELPVSLDNVRKMTSLTRLLANAADSAVTVCLEHPEDAERAKLRDRTDLRGLALHWSHGMVSTEKVKFKEMDAKTMDLHSRLVLERLIPPRTLENMELFGYMSKDFPGWMFDISTYLPCLGCIELYDLKHCDSLPPFGQLPNLRILDMTSMPSIKKVGKKFYRRGGTCKKLRVIRLHVLENLAEWWTTWSGEDEEEFLIPNLHLLRVTHCPKLKFLPYPPKSMHWNLFNSDKMFPLHGFGRLSSSTLPVSTKLHGLKNFSTEHWGAAQHLGPTLETLDLEARSSLRTFPDVAPCFSSLRHFSLYLPDLEVLPEWLWQLNYLEKLHIGGCRILSSLPDSIQNLTALKELHITSCPELTSFPDSIQNLTALKNLRIYNCPRLSQWCQGEGAHRISHIPHRYRF